MFASLTSFFLPSLYIEFTFLEELEQIETPLQSLDQTQDHVGQTLATAGSVARCLDSWRMSTGQPYMEQKWSQQLQQKEQGQLLPGLREKHRSDLSFACLFLQDTKSKAT